MNKKKFGLCFLGVVTSIAALSVAFLHQTDLKLFSLFRSGPTTPTLVLNSSNTPSEISGNTYKETASTAVQTANGNTLHLSFVLAKSASGAYAQLANRGYLYNFGYEDGRITGITSITPILSSGSLSLRTTNAELVNGGAFLGASVNLTSGSKYTLPSSARYFQLQAGDSGAVITSLTIGFNCTDGPSATPTGLFNVEDFESYTATGVGWDVQGSGHPIHTTSNLRSAFYSTYYGGGFDPTNGSGWTKMGSTDYLTYNGTGGRNGSKCALFKTNGTNNFNYIQTKAYFGINSAIGKGTKLSMWVRGAYTDTSMTTAFGSPVTVKIFALYNAKYSTSGANGASIATYSIPANVAWSEITVDLDSTKNYYAFGIGIQKASGQCYLPVDDVCIYTTSPYSPVSVTGISLSESSATISIGDTKTLIATISPWNATNKTVTWTTSDASIATVNSSGVVTGVDEGSATITARSSNGMTATCAITVQKTYPGGTYFTTITVYSKKINVEIVMSTRDDVRVWLYGSPASNCYFKSYNSSTGYFELNASVSTDYGDVTGIEGYYRNDQLEEVQIKGSLSNLVSGKYTIPHPSNYYWDCNGTDAQLQSTFKRRYRNGSSWAEDNSNADRLTADSVNKTSSSNGVKIRGFATGVALNSASYFSAAEQNTFCFWVYNPTQTTVKFRIFLYRDESLDPNSSSFELTDSELGFNVPATSWKYYRMGFGNYGYTARNFQICYIGASQAVAFTVDDIWFHN